MTATICYRCDDNLALAGKLPEKYLDPEGNKPCAECLQEMADEEDEGEDA